MNREQEAINRLCLLVGALSILAPKENDAIREILNETITWLNTPNIQLVEQAQPKGEEKG